MAASRRTDGAALDGFDDAMDTDGAGVPTGAASTTWLLIQSPMLSISSFCVGYMSFSFWISSRSSLSMALVVVDALTASEGKALFTTTLDMPPPPPPYGIARSAPGTPNGPSPRVLCLLRLECTFTVTLFCDDARADADVDDLAARFLDDLLRRGGMVLP